MNTRKFLALAAFGGLLVAAGCSGNKDNATDSAGTSAMTDTTGMGSMGTTGTMMDSTGATTGTTGTMTDSAAVPMTGDTTTRR